MQNNLELIIKETGVSKAQSSALLDSFGTAFVQAHKLATKAKGIKVTSENQVDEMAMAREIRLQLKDVRVEANKTKVILKEGYLRGGNAVQKIFNDIKDICKPEEDRLLEQEKFAERLKAEKQMRIERDRSLELSKYVDDVEVFTLHPDQLSTESYNKILETQKGYFELKKAKEEQEEQELLAQIEADKKEQEKIKKENAKLKAEADKRDIAEAKKREDEEKKLAQIKKEKEEAENKLRLEREVIAQEKAKNEAKEKAIKEAQDEIKRKALLAPDKEKLMKLANNLLKIELPAVKSNEAQKIVNDLKLQLEKLSNIVKNEAQKL